MGFKERFEELCREVGVTRADIDGGMTLFEFARRLDAVRSMPSVHDRLRRSNDRLEASLHRGRK